MKITPSIYVSVITDLTTDQRVIRICSTLQQMGFEVTVLARELRGSLPLGEYPFAAKRIKCYFSKGVMQYAEFNLKLFWRLLFCKTHYLLANDLDSLLPNYLVCRLRGKKLFYDTHEYFTGVPELRQSPIKRKIWKWIEDFIFPKLPVVYTVNECVQQLYKNEYGNTIGIVRNVPMQTAVNPMPMPEAWQGKKIILMQGAGINVGRGGLELLEALRLLLEDYILVYIGGGTQWDTIAQKTIEWQLQHRVSMLKKMAPADLKRYTPLAHIGCSLDSFDDINYRCNLPNKIFDYIHASVPVLATAIPEVKRIVETYQCGVCIQNLDAGSIAHAIRQIVENEDNYNLYQQNCSKAAAELNWETESEKLKAIYRPYL